MCEVTIRRAKFKDIPQLDRLLFEVHKIHSDIRPDLFTVGEKKYTDEELERIIVDEQKPIFVAEHSCVIFSSAAAFTEDLSAPAETLIAANAENFCGVAVIYSYCMPAYLYSQNAPPSCDLMPVVRLSPAAFMQICMQFLL